MSEQNTTGGGEVKHPGRTTRVVSHEEAQEVASRLIAGAFNRTDLRPRFSIPCRPDHDDDCLISSYIEQQAARATAAERERDELRAALQQAARDLFLAARLLEDRGHTRTAVKVRRDAEDACKALAPLSTTPHQPETAGERGGEHGHR